MADVTITQAEAEAIKAKATGNREERRAHLQAVPDPASEPAIELRCGRAARQMLVRHGDKIVVNKVEHGIFWTCECGVRGDTYNPQVVESVIKIGRPVPTQCPQCRRKVLLSESRILTATGPEAMAMMRSALSTKKA